MNVASIAAAPLEIRLECRAANMWRALHTQHDASQATEEDRVECRMRVLSAVEEFEALSEFDRRRLRECVQMGRISPKSALMKDASRFQRSGWLSCKVEENPGPDGERGVNARLTPKGAAGTGHMNHWQGVTDPWAL